jgi:glycosyltransferase involved in cell wall biosynthesis
MAEGGVKLALVVPGGVDRSGEVRVIPALVCLVERIARTHEVHVFALHQEPSAGKWQLAGATVHNIGEGWTQMRAIAAIRSEHLRAPFDLIQAIFSGPCGSIAVVAAKLLRRPVAVHVAGVELIALHDIGCGGRRTWKGRLRENWVLHRADAVTAASAPMIDALRAMGVAAQRVPLGVDLKKWPPLAPRERRQAPARLIHVASLNRVKDQATLLRALAAVAGTGLDFRMDIVGFDTLGGEMQRLAQTLGLEQRVRFHGFKTQSELRPIMEAADLLVMSSRHEAGPLAVLEAAVAGVPTVGTAVGHIAEWAPSAALAVPVGNPARLANAICLVLSNEDCRLYLARAAQGRALLEDADCTARAFESLHQQLVRIRNESAAATLVH